MGLKEAVWRGGLYPRAHPTLAAPARHLPGAAPQEGSPKAAEMVVGASSIEPTPVPTGVGTPLLCGPLRVWGLAALFLGAKGLCDTMAWEGETCRALTAALSHSAGGDARCWEPLSGVSRVWGPPGEPPRAQRLLRALPTPSPPELIADFGQPQAEETIEEQVQEVSGQAGQGAGSPGPSRTGGCWWVLLRG